MNLFDYEMTRWIQKHIQSIAKEQGEVCKKWIDYDVMKGLPPDEISEYYKNSHSLGATVAIDHSFCRVYCSSNDLTSGEMCNCLFPKTEVAFLKDFKERMPPVTYSTETAKS